MVFEIICKRAFLLFTVAAYGNFCLAQENNTKPTFKNIYAVVIGISNYQNKEIQNLKFAAKDAQLFAEYLLQAYPKQVKPIKNLKLLLDDSATLGAIDAAITWLSNVTKQGDLAIFYFAGHGGLDMVKDKSPGYLLAVNANPRSLSGGGAYQIGMLDGVLNDDIAKNNKATTICILDACHAGKSNDAIASARVLNRRLGDTESDNPGNVVKILASLGNESSLEYDDLCQGHGVFTYYLIKGLLTEADKNHDGYIDITELESYLKSTVPEKTGKQQTPKVLYDNASITLSIRQGEASATFNCFYDGKITNSNIINYTHISETDFIHDQLNEIQRAHYNLFNKSLKDSLYLEPKSNSAIYYYDMLKEDKVPNSILDQIKSQWKIKFQDYAQSLIIDYLNESNIANYGKYERAAKMLTFCLQYTDKSDLGYNFILSKQIWLECYSTNRKIEKGILKISQNEQREIRLSLIKRISQAIQLDSMAAYLRNTQGALYRDIGLTKQAEASYREAIRLAPRWTYPRNNLSLVLSKVEDKIASLDSCIILNPNMYLAYANLAVKYRYNKKDTLKCRQYLDKALEICIRNNEESDDIAWIYQQYGYLYQARQMKKEAESCFIKSIKIYGDLASSYRVALANFYSESNENQKAKVELDNALKINPKDANTFASYGYRSIKMQNYPEAIDWYKKSLLYDSTNGSNYYRLAFCYRQIDSLNKADGIIDVAIRLEPDELNNLAEKANINLQKNDTVVALKYYNKCLELDPQSDYTYYALSYVYRLKDPAEAEKLMRKAIDIISPNEDWKYYDALGYILSGRTHYDKALIYYKKALDINPKETSIILNMAEAYSKLNKKENALNLIENAINNELATQSITNADAVSYFKKKLVASGRSYYYYAIGYCFEKNLTEGKRKNNNKSAVSWYMYAAQMGAKFSLNKLLKLSENGYIKKTFNNELTRLSKINDTSENIKSYSFYCLLPDSSKKLIRVYIAAFPRNIDQVMEEEMERVKEVYNATIPVSVIQSFNELYALASKNKISYLAVCDYAMNYTGKSKKTSLFERKNISDDNQSDNNKEDVTLTATGKNVIVNEESNIIYAINNGQTANLTSRMKAAIEQKIGIDVKDFEKSYSILINKLKSDKEQKRIYYYALGYLFERSSAGSDISNARKWYGYAFQMGYSPSYYKLDSLYKFVSRSKVEWLKLNYEKDFTAISVAVNENKDKYDIYIMDFPPDPTNPIGHEIERLKDVYGVTVSGTTAEYFKRLYDLSLNKHVSFTDLCRYAMDEPGAPDSLAKATNNSVHYYYLGNSYYNEKRYAKAAESYEMALKIAPENMQALNNAGIAYTYLKQYEKGLTYFRKQLQIDKSRTSLSYYNMACNFSLQGKTDEALKYLEESFKAGYTYNTDVEKDVDLDNIRDSDEYRALIKKYGSRK